jgi:GH35 family endo-1,4-beta-xylanase
MKTCNHILLLLFAVMVNKTFAQQNATITNADATLMQDHLQIEIEYLARAKQNIETYRKGDVSITILDAEGNPVKNATVTINQVTQDFLFGNLCEEIFSPRISPQDSITFTKRFTDLFNFTEITAIKWAPYEPQQGKTGWQQLQRTLDWCMANHITTKGHTLGWTHDAGTPHWLLKLPANEAMELYKARILNLVGGFKNQIKMWDVVNEPVNTIPLEKAMQDTISGNGQIDAGFRYNVKGITIDETLPWVENSFNWTKQADPAGDFILNEFYLIAKPEVREKFYDLVKALQRHKAPVTGLGIQAHEPREQWFSPVEIMNTFDQLKDLGLPLHITEFIPQSSGKPITGGWRQGSWTEEAQAEFSEQFYTLAFSYPSIKSIHWWAYQTAGYG